MTHVGSIARAETTDLNDCLEQPPFKNKLSKLISKGHQFEYFQDWDNPFQDTHESLNYRDQENSSDLLEKETKDSKEFQLDCRG